MALDGKMFCFTNAGNVRQILLAYVDVWLILFIAALSWKGWRRQSYKRDKDKEGSGQVFKSIRRIQS